MVLLTGCVLACAEFEPPPDIDTSTGDAEDGAEPEDLAVMFDGTGRGLILPARLRDIQAVDFGPSARHGLVIGAPSETWEDVVEAGQASLLIDDGNGLTPPHNGPSTYVERLKSNACLDDDQRFAWDLLPGRRLGHSMTFFSRNLGESFSRYENVPLVAAPTAGADSGRVMVWLRCMSCAIFPKPDGIDNVVGGQFGSSMAVGIFAGDDEKLIVGSPALGDGEVAVISQHSFAAGITSGTLRT
jgi:hypothetical protein